MTPFELAVQEVPSLAGMYGRYARDLSDELFNSVYNDLYALAERQQRSIYAYVRRKGRRMYVGEAQTKLSEFCNGRISLGDALDYINRQKAVAAIAEAHALDIPHAAE